MGGSGRWIGVLVLVAGVAVQTSAQQAPGARYAVEATVARQVSISAEKASLSSVVESIIRQAGLNAAYDASLLEKAARVTLRVEFAAVQSVLDRILRPEGLVAKVDGYGYVTITRHDHSTIRNEFITGKVIRRNGGQPVSGATVTIEGESQTMVTDADGTFRLAVVPGEYRVSVRAVGFSRQVKTITIDDGTQVSIEFQLDATASVLNEVVVTGTVVATERKAIATPVTVITAEEIQQRGITRLEEFLRGDVPGVLALDPGAARYGDDGLGAMVTSEVYSRGAVSQVASAQPNPLKTYVDGIEIVDPSYLGTLDMQSVERIEIIAGPQAATIYGSGAMGGVIQVFTKKGTRNATPELMLRLRYGMLENSFSSGLTPSHAHSIALNGSIGAAVTYSATGSYGYTGQWMPDLFSRTYGLSLGATATQGMFVVSGSTGTTWGANGMRAGDRRLNPTRQELISQGIYFGEAPASFTSKRRGSSEARTASIAIDMRASSHWQHSFSVGRSQVELAARPMSPQHYNYRDTLWKFDRSIGYRNTLSYNSQFQISRGNLSSSFVFGLNGSSGKTTNLGGYLASARAREVVTTQGIVLSDPEERERWGGFGNWRLGVFDQLFITLGIRGEKSPAYGRSHAVDWTPTNGVAYTMSYQEFTIKLMGSYGRATREPQPDWHEDQWDNFQVPAEPQSWLRYKGNPNLRPEVSRGPQGGLELYYGSLGGITINRYKQFVDDLISTVIVDTQEYVRVGETQVRYQNILQYQNVGKILQHGWEMTGSINLFGVALKSVYSWTDSRLLYTAINNYEKGRLFNGLPTHSGMISVGYARGSGMGSLAVNYVGARTYPSTLYGQYQVGFPFNYRLQEYVPQRYYLPRVGKPGYYKANFSSSYRLNADIQATLNVTNVGNNYESDEAVAFPTLGRQTQLGVSIRY